MLKAPWGAGLLHEKGRGWGGGGVILLGGHFQNLDCFGGSFSKKEAFPGGWPWRIGLQSWTKSVKNSALSYTQDTHPAYLAPWWPLPPPLPGQCCLVGSKNVRATLQHCFFWGGSILSEPGFRGKYSKIKHITCIFLNIFVQDCIFEILNGMRHSKHLKWKESVFSGE